MRLPLDWFHALFQSMSIGRPLRSDDSTTRQALRPPAIHPAPHRHNRHERERAQGLRTGIFADEAQREDRHENDQTNGSELREAGHLQGKCFSLPADAEAKSELGQKRGGPHQQASRLHDLEQPLFSDVLRIPSASPHRFRRDIHSRFHMCVTQSSRLITPILIEIEKTLQTLV